MEDQCLDGADPRITVFLRLMRSKWMFLIRPKTSGKVQVIVGGELRHG